MSNETPEYVVMFGKAFDNPDKCVRTKVHRNNIEAFKASGWEVVEDADACELPENAPVYADVAKKGKTEPKEREPLETSPQTLNTEPVHDETDEETSKESNPKTIKKTKK